MKYQAVNHSLQESSDFMYSFQRNRVFKGPDQILQDRYDKSHQIEKPSRYVVSGKSVASANQSVFLRKNLKSQNADRRQ